MTREIKFRAWDKKSHTMTSHEDMQSRSIFAIADDLDASQFMIFPNHEDVVLMQYVGLKDKNGVEIYDGDILNWDYNGETDYYEDWMKEPIYKVEYQDGHFVCAKGLNKDLFLHSFRFKYTEILGNIYQNPELLNP